MALFKPIRGAVLLCADSVILLFSALIDGIGGNGPFRNLDTNAVLAGFEGNQITADVNDLSDHTADRCDLVADRKIVSHLFCLFLLFILGTDQEEIEDDKHYNKYNDTAVAAGAGGSAGIGRSCGCAAGEKETGYDRCRKHRNDLFQSLFHG